MAGSTNVEGDTMSTWFSQICQSNPLRKRSIGLIVLLSLIGGSLFLCCGPLLANLLRPPTNASVNSVTYLAETYGVSEKKVLELTEELGVDAERLAEYGPGDFPYNYFTYRLKQIDLRKGITTKEDVEAIVQGYEVKCEISPNNIVYLFYSDRLTSRIFDRLAMMLEFDFNLDFSLEQMNQPNLADSGHEWQKQTIKEKCLGQQQFSPTK